METLEVFKALADEIRLRILRAVSSAELSVAELVQVLGLPQSTVSRHLKPLRDTGLVDSRRDGTSMFYRRGPVWSEQGFEALLNQSLKQLALAEEDGASIRRVLDARRRNSRDFFDRVAGTYGTLTEPGGGWNALAAGLAAGFEGKQIADLGAGEGSLSLLLAPLAAGVTAVDHSPRMLGQIAERAEALGLSCPIRLVEGDLEALPLADECMDAVFLSQALHHASQPGLAVAEAGRITSPGGVLVILDLAPHEEEWVKEQWADQWLGFSGEQLNAWIEQAGLKPVHHARLAGSTPELSVQIAIARKNTK